MLGKSRVYRGVLGCVCVCRSRGQVFSRHNRNYLRKKTLDINTCINIIMISKYVFIIIYNKNNKYTSYITAKTLKLEYKINN